MSRIFGRFVLLDVLSTSERGEAHRAIDSHTHRLCVVKTISPAFTPDPEFRGRLVDETRKLIGLHHKGIVRALEAGKIGDTYYLVTEHIRGRDLGDVLDRAYMRRETIPLDLGLFLAHELLEVLDYIHELGMLHRDITPANVMIGFDGSVKLIDFDWSEPERLPDLARIHLVVGSYGTMPPERARLEPLDARADLFSLGATLFEVFTGARLVDESGETDEILARVLNPVHRTPRSVVPSLPPAIDDLIARAIAPDRKNRFASAQEMKSAVDSLRTKASTALAFRAYLGRLYPEASHPEQPVPRIAALRQDPDSVLVRAGSG